MVEVVEVVGTEERTPEERTGGAHFGGASAGASRAFLYSDGANVSGAPTATVGSAFASAAAPSSVSSRRVATDPALGAVGRALAESGLVRACLSAVENARLEDLILPTQNAAARLDAIRAAFSLLLRLARLPGGGAKALAESGAMAALVNCRAVDAYASDSPGDAAAAAVAADARARAPRANRSTRTRRVSDSPVRFPSRHSLIPPWLPRVPCPPCRTLARRTTPFWFPRFVWRRRWYTHFPTTRPLLAAVWNFCARTKRCCFACSRIVRGARICATLRSWRRRRRSSRVWRRVASRRIPQSQPRTPTRVAWRRWRWRTSSSRRSTR